MVSKKKNPSFMWGCDIKIRPSLSPFVITWHASGCQTVILAMDFSISPSHSWWILTVFNLKNALCLSFFQNLRIKMKPADLGLSLILHPHIVYASSGCSGESAHLRRLAWAFIACLCVTCKYKIIIPWLIYITFNQTGKLFSDIQLYHIIIIIIS